MANDNPELLDGFATNEASLVEAISTELASYGWSLTNSKINGKQLNTMFNQIFGYLNYLQKKGLSFWQEDKPYVATTSYIDIVRRGNKIYFAKQDSNPDPVNNPLPKAPESNPDYWGLILDLDNPPALGNHNHNGIYALLTGSATQSFKVKSATANDEAVNLEQLNTAVGNINQSLFIKPISRYNKVLFIKLSPSSIVIPAGFKVAVGNSVILVASDYTLSLNSNLDTGSKTPGKDYYVYATPAGAFYLSANNAITTDRLIGGFHYGLTGESEVLPTNALKTETDMIANRGIKAYSMWDLAWKPANKRPEGKVLVNDTFWRDIYPADENYGIRGYSSCFALDGVTPAKLAGGAETSGRKFPKIPLSKGGNGTLNYGSLTWFEANEIISEVGMRMISYDEFSNSSYGVVEQKSLSQLGYTIGTGTIQHYPELESKWGVEMAVGCQWFWTKELMNGYGTTDFANRTGLTDGRGYIYATSNSPVAGIVGGQEQHNSTDPGGSRALALSAYVWSTSWYFGFVAVCDHMNLDK